jgi:hypothetical protein
MAFDRLGTVGLYIVSRSDILLLFIPQTAEQGARANAHSRHAACYRMKKGPKKLISDWSEARVAPAVGVAHL